MELHLHFQHHYYLTVSMKGNFFDGDYKYYYHLLNRILNFLSHFGPPKSNHHHWHLLLLVHFAIQLWNLLGKNLKPPPQMTMTTMMTTAFLEGPDWFSLKHGTDQYQTTNLYLHPFAKTFPVDFDFEQLERYFEQPSFFVVL